MFEAADIKILVEAVRTSSLADGVKAGMLVKLGMEPMVQESAKALGAQKERTLQAIIDALLSQQRQLAESVGELVAFVADSPEADTPEAREQLESMRQTLALVHKNRLDVEELLRKDIWSAV